MWLESSQKGLHGERGGEAALLPRLYGQWGLSLQLKLLTPLGGLTAFSFGREEQFWVVLARWAALTWERPALHPITARPRRQHTQSSFAALNSARSLDLRVLASLSDTFRQASFLPFLPSQDSGRKNNSNFRAWGSLVLPSAPRSGLECDGDLTTHLTLVVITPHPGPPEPWLP